MREATKVKECVPFLFFSIVLWLLQWILANSVSQPRRGLVENRIYQVESDAFFWLRQCSARVSFRNQNDSVTTIMCTKIIGVEYGGDVDSY